MNRLFIQRGVFLTVASLFRMMYVHSLSAEVCSHVRLPGGKNTRLIIIIPNTHLKSLSCGSDLS